MKGIVKAVSQKNNSVLMEVEGVETWFALGPRVKISYVKEGECEFTGSAEGISYIKSAYQAQTQAPQTMTTPIATPPQTQTQTESYNPVSMYAAYAKDIFVGFLAVKEKGKDFDATELMRVCIGLVKQSKRGFE